MKSLRKILDAFHDLPNNLSGKQLRFYVFINYAFLIAGVFHFAFIWVFATFDLSILSIYNIFSSILWGLCIYSNIKGARFLHILIANAEVLIHAFLCVLMLGWNSGFHYYILSVPLVIFLSPWKIHRKILLCAFNCIAYVLLFYFYLVVPPKPNIDPKYILGFNYINMTSIFVIISVFGYYYRRIVLDVEQKLNLAHNQTAKAFDRINDDLAGAANYVQTILPQPIRNGPIISDWRFIPSESLGGDAFGYNWIDEENFAIYLLDVSGHGVSAALLSATIMNVLRSSSLPKVDFSEPDQVLSALNTAFPSDDNNDMFFTIWYGVYNKTSRTLKYSSGGHPPAILRTNSDLDMYKFFKLGTGNNIVGAFKDENYFKNEKYLKNKSELYVFSDGVYEFPQPGGKRWKYNEFLEHLKTSHLVLNSNLDILVSSINKVNKSGAFEDDFTILKVSFN
jgi:sigma-B regulation protein RsbU (phosphoserine phosphatase)